MIEIFLILFVTSSLADENLLRGKPVNVSDYPDYAKNIADGDRSSCMWLRSSNINFVVFDLGKVHQIDKVIMYNRRFRGMSPFSVYLGNEFQVCHFPKQLKKFKLCKAGLVQDSERMEFNCTESGNSGRYFAVVKGRFFSTEILDEMNFCELEAFGKPLFDIDEIQRPVLVNQPLPPIRREEFPLVDILRKDVPVVTVGKYAAAFIKVNKLCQPIIWDPKKNLTFALACETNNRKGRAVFFGKEWYFWNLKEDELHKRMQSNYYRWLSPNLNITDPVYSKTLKTVNDVLAVREGEIVEYSDEAHNVGVIDTILEQLSKGKISFLVDSNFRKSDSYNKERERILNFFNIAISKTYFTFRETGKYTIRDEDFTEELYDIEDGLLRYINNTDALSIFVKMLIEFTENSPARLFKDNRLGNIYRKYVDKFEELLNYICPCKYAPAVNKDDRKLLRMLPQLFESQSLAHSDFKLPCLDMFPEEFKTCPKRSTVTLEIYGEIAYTRNPTGYYLEAGNTIQYEIESSEGDWSVSVGCQTDRLKDSQSEWPRYPDLFLDSIEISGKGTVYSPYGGPVWITNNIQNTTLRIRLSNVVATPFFNIHDKNAIDDWDKKQRLNPGLWAQVAGQDMVMCPISDWVRGYSGEYMDRIVRSWDKIVRGVNALSSEDWRTHRPEQTVFDLKTSAGWGHSGYPISTHLDWFDKTLNETAIKMYGSYVMCHELGHNRQDSRWTFSSVTESTNNIFCYVAFQKVWNLPAYGVSLESLGNDVKGVKTHLDRGASYQSMVDSTDVQSTMYGHLLSNMGIGFYHEVFAYYSNHNEIQPATDPEKIDMWVNITSRVTGMNLVPTYDFWGLPIGESIRKDLSALPCFIPDDHLTGLSVSRTKTIVDKYPDCLRKSKYFKDFDMEKYIQGERPNFIKVIPN